METKQVFGKILHWTPRVLTIMFILFLGLFALDVFSGDYITLEMLLGLTVHLLPNLALALALIIAWKWQRVGGIIFLFLGFGFMIFFNTYRQLMTFLIISGPLFLIGALFVFDWYFNKK